MNKEVVPVFRRAEDAPSGVLPVVDTLMSISVSSNTTNTLLNTTDNTSLTSSLSQLQQQPKSSFSFSSPSDQTATILAVGLMIVFFYFCCQRPRVPGPEHWRGAAMRRNYLDMLAREQAKEQREAQTPEYRQRLVTHNMRTKVRSNTSLVRWAERDGAESNLNLMGTNQSSYPFPFLLILSESHISRYSRKLDAGDSR